MNNDDFYDNYYINEVDEPVTTRHSRNNTTAFKSYKKETNTYLDAVKELDASINNLLSYNLFGEKKKVKKLKKYKALGFHSAQEYYGWLQSNGLQIYSYDTELSNSINSLDYEITAVLSRYKID